MREKHNLELHHAMLEPERSIHHGRVERASAYVTNVASTREEQLQHADHDVQSEHQEATEEKYVNYNVQVSVSESSTPVFSHITASQSEAQAFGHPDVIQPPSPSPSFETLPLLWQYIPQQAKYTFRALMRNILIK